MAEAYYGVPEDIKRQVISYLDDALLQSLNSFYSQVVRKSIGEEKTEDKVR